MNLKNLAVIAVLSLAAARRRIRAERGHHERARIIDGTGKVIEHGSVTAKDGKITSVASGDAAGSTERASIAHGMTVMASFIDAHRHLIRGDSTAWLKDKAPASMKAFVDAGFTTVFSMGDDPKGILELRRRLRAGEIVGPTLYAAYFMLLTSAPAAARSSRASQPLQGPRPHGSGAAAGSADDRPCAAVG